jgi:negative regulator of genetic competence, sporulation and motility
MEYWGKHLIIAKFVDELVVKIDMIKYGPLWIERFATHDPIKAGISFIQMIETSNISGHFVDHDGDFYLDVFSCKDYDEDEVIALVEEYFTPEDLVFDIAMRDAKLNTQ